MPSLLPAVLLVVACSRGSPPSSPATTAAPAVVHYTYAVVSSYPHDPEAFTQGLAYYGNELYEGTGLEGRSSLRKVQLGTGSVLQRRDIPPPYFGEGITVFGDMIFQLTWQSRKGFIYDRTTFEPRGEFAYETEGWGLTHDGRRLIMSDGTATLRFLDPGTLSVAGSVEVHDDNGLVIRLNELEYVKGRVLANVWQTDTIVIIDPGTGRMTGRIDLSGLLGDELGTPPVDVLNGIAYDAAGDRLFVTGKLWPRLFEIKLVPVKEGSPWRPDIVDIHDNIGVLN